MPDPQQYSDLPAGAKVVQAGSQQYSDLPPGAKIINQTLSAAKPAVLPSINPGRGEILPPAPRMLSQTGGLAKGAGKAALRAMFVPSGPEQATAEPWDPNAPQPTMMQGLRNAWRQSSIGNILPSAGSEITDMLSSAISSPESLGSALMNVYMGARMLRGKTPNLGEMSTPGTKTMGTIKPVGVKPLGEIPIPVTDNAPSSAPHGGPTAKSDFTFDPEVSKRLIEEKEAARRAGRKERADALAEKERRADEAKKAQDAAHEELRSKAERIQKAIDELEDDGLVPSATQFHKLDKAMQDRVLARAEQLKTGEGVGPGMTSDMQAKFQEMLMKFSQQMEPPSAGR